MASPPPQSRSRPARVERRPSGPREKLFRSRTAPRRLLADRAAGWVVTAGGLAIIASILGILLFILVEIWPMTRDARVATAGDWSQPAAEHVELPLAAAVVDEHRTHLAGIGSDGVIRVLELDGRNGGRVVATADPIPGPRDGSPAPTVLEVAADAGTDQPVLTAALSDGRILAVPVRFGIHFDGQERRIEPRIGDPVTFRMVPDGDTGAEPAAGELPLRAWTAQLAEDGGGAAAAQLGDGRLVLVRRSVRESFLSGEIEETLERSETPVSYRLTELVLDGRTANVYAGTGGGELLWWPVGPDGPQELQVVSAGRAGITALSLLIGDRSLVVGQGDGSLSVWFRVEPDASAPQGGPERLTRIRSFEPHPGAVIHIEPSPREKGFLAVGADSSLGLYHSTSHRTLWRGEAPLASETAATGLAFAPKADGAYLLSREGIVGLDIHNPHPEITWKTLFGRVWYEGYDEPAYVWQSSSGTDDFEPKLSLTPLLVGTLKGTFYSLLLAIPLGILGAMYLSHFMHPSYKRWIKPVIEIMASLPSVVLGFLAGLWLAPRLEAVMPAVFLMFLVLPALVLATGGLWSLLPRRVRNRIPTGSEMFLFAVASAAGIWLSIELEPLFELLVFGGDFQTWLRDTTGLPFDQRNAIVVGIAMGFAVIPIIFAISEDAFSNVPPNLVAGSLALGANRWQTVTRVVLPTASPGIFSAVMVGFGRAVGETMIVLMATGNTPIMDWNPFNGFRTLSANIAVEIPEAPHGGTLYRTLFLAALLLFVLTFVVNTVSELVRHRLRERYSKL